jgi:rare lipoprotein A
MKRLNLLAIAPLLWAANCATTTIHTGTGPLYSGDRKGEPVETSSRTCETTPVTAVNPAVQRPSEQAVVTEQKPQERTAPGYTEEESSYFDQNTPPKENESEKPQETTPAIDAGGEESGTASWYGRDFDGKPTASGETFDSRKLTAAHKTLPLGTVILVKNTENQKEVLVTVNDRGPFVKGRILDLSEYGAEVLGYKEKGLTTVSLRVVRRGEGREKGPGSTAAVFSEASQLPQGNGPDQVKPVMPNRPKVETPANVPAESTLGKYSIQVGLFSDYENADRMAKYLSSYGQPVHIFQRGTSYVVKVGEYADRLTAEPLKNRLSSDGYTAFISNP